MVRALRAGAAVDVEGTVGRWFTAAETADDGPVVRHARHRLATVLGILPVAPPGRRIKRREAAALQEPVSLL